MNESTNEKTNYSAGNFEGPLDLLLFLIKKKEINIYDIPIGEITEQFLEYLDYAVSTDLGDLTDFYSMAADLLYIKSKMLLPMETILDDGELEDPRQELVDKLIEYQKFKKLSALMEEREDQNEWSFERKRVQRLLPFEEEELWDYIDEWESPDVEFLKFACDKKYVPAYSTLGNIYSKGELCPQDWNKAIEY